MKRITAIHICLLLALFLCAGMVQRTDAEPAQMEALIADRIEILTAYFCREADYDETRDKLEAIEMSDLLTHDLEQMTACMGTDIEQVTQARVTVTACRRDSHGIVRGNATVRYRIAGLSGTARETGTYRFTGEVDGAQIRLTQLKRI